MKKFLSTLLAFVFIALLTASPAEANHAPQNKKRLSNLSLMQRYELKKRHKQHRATFGNGIRNRKQVK